jgi:hypothetical protein
MRIRYTVHRRLSLTVASFLAKSASVLRGNIDGVSFHFFNTVLISFFYLRPWAMKKAGIPFSSVASGNSASAFRHASGVRGASLGDGFDAAVVIKDLGE